MTTISRIESRRWDLADAPPVAPADALAVLEDGDVLLLPELPIDAPAAALLDPHFADATKKNIAFDAASGTVKGFSDATRVSSWRKDDSRLHIHAFPSRPTQGQRIQCMLEQTALLPTEAMAAPGKSPLAVLQSLA